MRIFINTVRRKIPGKWQRMLIGLLLVAAGALTPETARAGTYKMYTCNVPGHPTAMPTTGPWAWTLDGLNTVGYDTCALGGTFGVRLNPGQRFMRPATSASLSLRRPIDGPLSRVGIVRYRTWLTAQLSGSGAPAFISDGGAFGPPGGSTSDSTPWVSPAFSQSNGAVHVQLYCSSGAPGNCIFASETPLQARGIEVDLYEDTPPSATIDASTLSGVETHDNTGTVSYSAVDLESGVARVEALVGGVSVGSHAFEADPALCPHTDFNACERRETGDIHIDTSSAAPGQQALTLRVTDAAGNSTLVTGLKIAVEPTQGSKNVRMSARFARSGRRVQTSRFNRAVRIRGRLTDLQGRGVDNADIVISEHHALSGASDDKRRVSTRTDGSFSFTTKRGPSRTIRLQFAGRVAGLAARAVRTLKLNVRASARLKVSLRGVRVRYSGRVTSMPLPRNGKLVYIQGRSRGGVWQTFAKRRTGHRGRFGGSYRLRVHRPGVRLEFRVRVPPEKTYPFVTGVGPAIPKTVR